MATTVTLKPNAIDISGSTSGTTTLQATAVAGTTVLTLPAATDTLVGKATTDTLTNKTLTSPTINGATIVTGTINNTTIGATTPTTGAFTTVSATGVATFSAGTAALPAITTTGDTNTGIFFPAADTIAFSEGGAEAMRIDSSGNVGIGVSTVATNFRTQFLGTAGSNTSAASSGTTQAASAVLRLQAGGGFTATLDIGQGGGTGSWLQSCDTGNLATTYPLLLNPVGGNVGIGTSSPSVKLDVSNGMVRLSSAYQVQWFNGATQLASILGDSGSNITFQTGSSNTERARIDSSGNVLVTNPAGLGYGTGSGGTVTQATNKGTAVTLNKPTGQITMNNAALLPATEITFYLNNSLITTSDLFLVNVTAGNSSYDARVVSVNTGNALIAVKNTTAGSLSEALNINFAIIKGATS